MEDPDRVIRVIHSVSNGSGIPIYFIVVSTLFRFSENNDLTYSLPCKPCPQRNVFPRNLRPQRASKHMFCPTRVEKHQKIFDPQQSTLSRNPETFPSKTG